VAKQKAEGLRTDVALNATTLKSNSGTNPKLLGRVGGSRFGARRR